MSGERVKTGAPVEPVGAILSRRRRPVMGEHPAATIERCLACGGPVVVATSETNRRYIIDPTAVLPGLEIGGRRVVLWFFIDGVCDPVGGQRVSLAKDDHDGRVWVEHHEICPGAGGGR